MAFPSLSLTPVLPFPQRPWSAAPSLRLALAVCLALGMWSCNQGVSAPFVKLTLLGLPASTVKIDVDVTLDATMKMPTPEFVGTASSLADVSISFPADSRGVLFIALRAIDATPCIVATGSVSVVLDMNQVYPAAILAMNSASGCQSPDATNMLLVSRTGDSYATGTITSSDGAISCGSACSASLKAGASVTLTATPRHTPAGTTYQFVSWSGAGPGCTTSPTCQFQLNATTAVTATFRCSGFCAETQFGMTSDLYGIWGFSPKDVVAVGADGTIRTTLSGTWAPATSPVTTTLRAVQASPDGKLGIAVGDGGAILSTTDGGGTWTQMQVTPPSTKSWRSVYVPSSIKAYAAGDELPDKVPYVMYNAPLWTPANQGGDVFAWYGITGLDSHTFLLLGHPGAARFVTDDMASNTIPQTGVSAPLLGACALSANKIIVVGGFSTLLKADMTTTQWTRMTPPQPLLLMRAVFCFGGSAAYAVGDGGNVWKYDGNSWTVIPSGTDAILYAIWGTSEADYYVVGSGGTILHYHP